MPQLKLLSIIMSWWLQNTNKVKKKVKSAYEPSVVHQAYACLQFLYSIKSPGTFLPSPHPGGDASPLQGYSPALNFAGTHLYTRLERDTVRVNCLPRTQHNVPIQDCTIFYGSSSKI